MEQNTIMAQQVPSIQEVSYQFQGLIFILIYLQQILCSLLNQHIPLLLHHRPIQLFECNYSSHQHIRHTIKHRKRDNILALCSNFLMLEQFLPIYNLCRVGHKVTNSKHHNINRQGHMPQQNANNLCKMLRYMLNLKNTSIGIFFLAFQPLDQLFIILIINIFYYHYKQRQVIFLVQFKYRNIATFQVNLILKQSSFLYRQKYLFIQILYTQECKNLIFILQPMLSEPSIKKRIETLKEQISAIRGVNADCKKQLITIEKQIKILQSRLHDPFSVVKDYFAIAKDTLRTQFEKQSILFDEQTEFLQNQIHQMIDDKLKAHQNCLILEEKIRHLNEDIG